MRVLALDYGSKTVGVAVTDELGLTALGLEIIRREKENHLRGTLRRIQELVSEYGVTRIVLGLPFNMDGSAGDRAEKTMEFRDMLHKKTGLPVELCDERLTTVEAEEIMRESGVKRRDYKQYVDEVAAVVILEDWMRQHPDWKDA